MTKVDIVRAEMVKAMKAGEKERKNALSMLLSALKNATIDKRSALTEQISLKNADFELRYMKSLYRR